MPGKTSVRMPGELFARPPAGSGLAVSPAGRIFVLQRRTTRSIATTRQKIGEVDAQILCLERQCDEKKRQADGLVHDVARTAGKAKDLHTLTGWTAIGLLGVCPLLGVAGLATAVGTADRADEARRRLNQVRQEQATIAARIERHRTTKASLQVKLGELRQIGDTLTTSVAAADALMRSRAATLEQARARLGVSRDLVGNLGSQLNIVTSIRDSAADLNVSLDGHVTHLRQQLAHAERLVAQSTRAYLGLVAAALAPDPGLAARGMLRAQTVSRAADLLRAGGLQADAATTLARLVVPPAEQRAFSEHLIAALVR
jgi:hypothetical protein